MAANCPCGKSSPFERCCGRFIHGGEIVPDAEHLMRSRYAAFVLRDVAWLLATWYPATRPTDLTLDEEPAPQWLGLQVQHFAVQDSDHATVEFVARYKINGRAHRLHELSRFERLEGRWFYREGDLRET